MQKKKKKKKLTLSYKGVTIIVGMIIQLCVAYCIVFPPYDFTLVLEPDCTFEQVLQPSPGDPVCSDILNCRRSLIKISLTVFTQFFYKYRTVRL